MKPDYVKIIFIGIPMTFLFWFFTLLVQMFVMPRSFNNSWFSLLLTILFVPIYFIVSIKYTKKITADGAIGKSNLTRALPQSSGILALVLVFLLVLIMIVCGVFLGIEVTKAYQIAIIPIAIAGTLLERYLRKRA